MPDTNPLLRGDSLIAYDLITLEHLQAAVDQTLESADDAVLEQIIKRQQRAPTWDDLVLAVEQLEARLQSAAYAMLPLYGRGPEWLAEVARLLDHVDGWFKRKQRNPQLYALYQRLADSDLGRNLAQDKQLTLQKRLSEYRLAGVLLDDPTRQRLAQLEQTIDRLEGEFKANLQYSVSQRGVHLDDPQRLLGVPALDRALMAAQAQRAGLQGWLIACQEVPCKAVLKYAKDRALREQVYRGYHGRGADADPQLDNGEVLQGLAEARHERAKLLGYADSVALKLAENHLQSGQGVEAFLADLQAKVTPLMDAQWQQLQGLAKAQGLEQIEPWDVAFLRQLLQGEVPALDEDTVRAFFPLDRVMGALVALTQQLFGVTLSPVTSVQAWHPSVLTFEVSEDHATLGHLYVDAVARDSKEDSSIYTTFVCNRRIDAEGVYHGPIAMVFSDTPQGVDGAPPLLDHLALRKLFHEFGHALHHLLVRTNNHLLSDTRRLGRVGNEVTSKLLERWVWSAEFLAEISADYRTGGKLPASALQAVLQRLRGDAVGEIAEGLSRALFDLDLHRNVQDGRTLQARAAHSHRQVQARPLADFERPVHAFLHLVSGYDATFYAYLWSDAHAVDLFTRFEQEGLRNGLTGRAFRERFIASGVSRTLAQNFADFMGRPLSLAAYQRRNGLDGAGP
ncbi:Oligopeptidase A [Pseudomonas reidholzensis]|uniref:Oligopeptidase A n=1 Tax=Pseudomonas reidholzensis TaxID=1785162 RepID=A0A383RLA0_9PSED|nr:M3 family metallopeptidase [Pseudomonas reidholzensis]SYX87860.1 Oligopeptidase A [Pseudomonas reidholzensis]